MHVDEFINDPRTDSYASWWFLLHRLPFLDVHKKKFSEYIEQFKLFCTYKGERYRVTMSDGFGDIGLSRNEHQEHGYSIRVSASECSEWSPELHFPIEMRDSGDKAKERKDNKPSRFQDDATFKNRGVSMSEIRIETEATNPG